MHLRARDLQIIPHEEGPSHTKIQDAKTWEKTILSGSVRVYKMVFYLSSGQCDSDSLRLSVGLLRWDRAI